MDKKGCIISKKYNGITKEETFSYQNGNYTLHTTIKIENGIIEFDNKKTHICNLENILAHYYNLDMEVTYKELKNLQSKNGFDPKEMYLAHLLASMGEPTCLFVNIESEKTEESITSSMLFLPKNIDLLTQNQKQKLIQLLKNTNTHFFETALCNGNIEEMVYFTNKKEIMKYLGLFPRGVILTQKYENQEIEGAVPYLNGKHVKQFPILIHDGKIILSEFFDHPFQLDMIIKNLFLMESTTQFTFYNHATEKERIGFHKDEIALASFLASLGEIPIIYVEGIYAGNRAKELGIQNEEYRSLMMFLPSNFDRITEKQLEFLVNIPGYLKENKITLFEIAKVSKRLQENEYFQGVEAYKLLVDLQDELEERKNQKKK